MALVLGIDSTGASVSVAIRQAEHLAIELFLGSGESALANLAPAVREALKMTQRKLSDLELLAVTTGPGSWAGIRIGIETAKMLSIAAHLPLVGVSSLKALAANLGGLTDEPVLVVLDAKKSRAYAAVYDCRQQVPIELSAPCTVACADLETLADGCHWLVGDTHLLPYGVRSRRLPGSSLIRGGIVALIGETEWAERGFMDTTDLIPNYMQPALPSEP